MRSNKGSIQFYIVGLLLVLISGFVIVLIMSEVSYGILSNQGNSACTLSNAFKNLYTGDDLAEQVLDTGTSNCKPISETIRPPDITNQNRMFDMCAELFEFYGSNEAAVSDNNFAENCMSYALMDRANSCWKTYLKGNAKFSGECNRICISEGFRTYYLNEESGRIILPKNSQLNLKISSKGINQLKLGLSELNDLVDLDEVDIKLSISETENSKIIDYEKGLSVVNENFYLVDIYSPNINSDNFGLMNDYYGLNNDFGPQNNIIAPNNLNSNNLQAGDQIVLGFVESRDLDLLEGGIKAFSLYYGKGFSGRASGVSLGGFIGELTTVGNVEISDNYIYLDRRGQC